MDESTPTRVTKDGKWEIDVGGGKYMLMGEIENMYQDYKKDYVTMTDIRKQAIDIKSMAEKDGRDNLQNPNYAPEGYDRVKATAKMDNTLRNSKLSSLMHDDVLENGEPWITAVKSNPEITGMTYESLGLMDRDIVAKVDTGGGPNGEPDGIIQENEKKTLLELGHQDLIVDALTNPKNKLYDEERTRGMMASYFTGFIGKQYDDAYGRQGGTTQSPAGEESMSDAEVIAALTKK